jgi:hypothetical protein
MVPSLALLSVSSAQTVCIDDLDFSVTTVLKNLLGLDTITYVEVRAADAVFLTLCVLLLGSVTNPCRADLTVTDACDVCK